MTRNAYHTLETQDTDAGIAMIKLHQTASAISDELREQTEAICEEVYARAGDYERNQVVDLLGMEQDPDYDPIDGVRKACVRIMQDCLDSWFYGHVTEDEIILIITGLDAGKQWAPNYTGQRFTLPSGRQVDATELRTIWDLRHENE